MRWAAPSRTTWPCSSCRSAERGGPTERVRSLALDHDPAARAAPGQAPPMRAVACRHGELGVVELDEPTPARGQVRLEVLRCGICGSDLHARHGIDTWAELAQRLGYDRFG